MSGTLHASSPAGGTLRNFAKSRWGGAVQVMARTVATMAVVAISILVLWVAALEVFDVSDYVGKGPDDVWVHLVRDEDAAQNRDEAFALLAETLRDAGIGFAAGMAVAVVLAVAIVQSRVLETAVMPLALILRSVPLIALAPIIILLVGRGPAVVAAMGGIVVLFPALVTIVFGLRSVTPQVRDVVTVYGGSSWTVLRKVACPTALPAFFSAVRISVPGSITGALLAEWLATGEGIGHAVVSAANRSQNTQVWALVVVVTLAALALYMVAHLVENMVLRHFAMAAPTR